MGTGNRIYKIQSLFIQWILSFVSLHNWLNSKHCPVYLWFTTGNDKSFNILLSGVQQFSQLDFSIHDCFVKARHLYMLCPLLDTESWLYKSYICVGGTWKPNSSISSHGNISICLLQRKEQYNTLTDSIVNIRCRLIFDRSEERHITVLAEFFIYQKRNSLICDWDWLRCSCEFYCISCFS